MSESPSSAEVQRLIARTRANRDKLNKRLNEFGESPHPIRSPLKERNLHPSSSAATSVSPAKGSGIRTTLSSAASSSSSAATTPGLPSRIRTNLSTPLRETTVTVSRDDPECQQRQTVDREVTEKRTTIEDSPVIDGDKETYTKTTITEKEEKIHKTEYVKFTEVGGSGSGSETAKEKLKALSVRFSKETQPESSEEDEDEGRPGRRGRRSRSASPVKDSPFKEQDRRRRTPSQSPQKQECRRRTPSPEKRTPIVTSTLRNLDEYDDETFSVAGRKKRLAALASKFNKYDDEDQLESTPADDEQNASITKEVDVDEELQRPPSPPKLLNMTSSPNKYRRQASENSATKNMAKDPNFIRSLKAQGFEETSSKSKLVYDFSKSPPKAQPSRPRSVSPSKAAAPPPPPPPTQPPRPTSPYKTHPLQFVSPQVSQASTAATPTSPKKPATESAQPPRPTSPYKPHPMQFISPQVNKSMGSPAAAATSPPKPPAKPMRTWAAAMDEDDAEVEGHNFRTEAQVEVDPQVARTDTASRRSMVEKRSIFEGGSSGAGSNDSPSVDPAMLSLSDRRKLFEKNRTVPKPIARFGESVTPSMLNRAAAAASSAAGPSSVFSKSTPLSRPPPKQLFTKTPTAAQSPPKTKTSPKRMASPIRQTPPKRLAQESALSAWNKQNNQRAKSPSPERMPPPQSSPVRHNVPPPAPAPAPYYPGVNSLKKVKMSPPKEGQLYPQVGEASASEDERERPSTAMSEAMSEAPSLGGAIKRAANAHRQIQERQHQRASMPPIAEPQPHTHDLSSTTADDGEIDDILDEAMDDEDNDSYTTSCMQSEGTVSPSHSHLTMASPTSSTVSWEYATPSTSTSASEAEAPERQQRKHHHDFKTPLAEAVTSSPQGPLPEVEGVEGGRLMHTVSFYRRQKVAEAASSATPTQRIVRNDGPIKMSEEASSRQDIQQEIRHLQEEAKVQLQHMEEASKALNLCISQNEFEGSAVRMEGERCLLEATHKNAAAMAEIRRLSTEGAIGKSSQAKKNEASASSGAITIYDIRLPLKADFLRQLKHDDSVHYFVVMVKHKNRVKTDMLSTLDGIQRGGGNKLNFFNDTGFFKSTDLDFDFQINIEVYALQTRREDLSHEGKQHRIKKEKSIFNLTPLKSKKRDGHGQPSGRHQNPVNRSTIRRPAFGLVGYTQVNSRTLKNKAFRLENLPDLSPLDGALEMELKINWESMIDHRGVLNLFTDLNGSGDWRLRQCRLTGNVMSFWRNPGDEEKQLPPTEQIPLSSCVTDTVSLAPREINSRSHTMLMETRRKWKEGDQDSLIMRVNRQTGTTTERHLLSAQSRDERIGWCNLINRALQNTRAWDPTAMRPRSDSQSSAGSDAAQAGAAAGADTISVASSEASSTDIW